MQKGARQNLKIVLESGQTINNHHRHIQTPKRQHECIYELGPKSQSLSGADKNELCCAAWMGFQTDTSKSRCDWLMLPLWEPNSSQTQFENPPRWTIGYP